MLSMKLVRMMVLFTGTILAFPACGAAEDEDAAAGEQNLCVSVADTTCEKLYECFPAAALAENGYPSTVAGCKAMLRDERGCEAADANDTCTGSQVFSRENATKCASQLRAASCNQILSSDDRADYAPACDRMCVVQ